MDDHFHIVASVVKPDHELTEAEIVELNPVRAGMVKHAKDYAFSSHNSSAPAVYGSSAGSDPAEGGMDERRLMRRVAQIGNGKIFGSMAFVKAGIVACGELWTGRRVLARAVEGGAYATHGHRLAEAAA